MTQLSDLLEHVRNRVLQVRRNLGLPAEESISGATSFSEVLDSMGLVEFVMVLADDCGTTAAAIEQCVERHFQTLEHLASAMLRAGLHPCNATRGAPSAARYSDAEPAIGTRISISPSTTVWMVATAVRLPRLEQSADQLDALLGKPTGWFTSHTGIRSRRLWETEDPLEAAAEAVREVLHQGRCQPSEVGTLLVTSEAPPSFVGLAAALHDRLQLPASCVALEIGGACTGYLQGLWLARQLIPKERSVLLIAVEAPSHHLVVRPGSAGEAAALFGDGAAATLLLDRPVDSRSLSLTDIRIGADGSLAELLKVERDSAGHMKIDMRGQQLAARAVRLMAGKVRELTQCHGIDLDQLHAVVAHGGNARMPRLLAHELETPVEKVWSATETTGNLGSATLPAAWAQRAQPDDGPIVWTAVGAGLTWGVALTGTIPRRP